MTISESVISSFDVALITSYYLYLLISKSRLSLRCLKQIDAGYHLSYFNGSSLFQGRMSDYSDCWAKVLVDIKKIDFDFGWSVNSVFRLYSLRLLLSVQVTDSLIKTYFRKKKFTKMRGILRSELP